jgi:hypothetical protein
MVYVGKQELGATFCTSVIFKDSVKNHKTNIKRHLLELCSDAVSTPLEYLNNRVVSGGKVLGNCLATITYFISEKFAVLGRNFPPIF